MEYIFFIILLLFTCLAYLVSNREMVSPFFCFNVSMIIAYSFVIANIDNWNVQISEKFVLYITIALFSWMIGSFCVKSFYKCNKINVIKHNLNSNYPYKSLFIIAFLCTFVYVSYQIYSVIEYSSLELTSILRTIYDRTVLYHYKPPFIINQLMEITISILYITICQLLLEKTKILKSNSFLKFTIITGIILIVFTTDRNIIIRMFLFYLMLKTIILYSQQKKINNNTIIKRGLVPILIFSGFFFLLGLLKNYTSDFLNSISIYAGSGLYNYNIWLKDKSDVYYLGEYTFRTFIRIIHTFVGLPINYDNIFGEFVEFEGGNGYVYSSNIYSAFHEYTMDFGIFGMIIFPLLLSIFFEFIYQYAKRESSLLYWVLYASLFYPIVYMPILEQFFTRFHLGMLYEIFWLVTMYSIAFRKIKLIKGNLT